MIEIFSDIWYLVGTSLSQLDTPLHLLSDCAIHPVSFFNCVPVITFITVYCIVFYRIQISILKKIY